MDCRVKPGNDDGGVRRRRAQHSRFPSPTITRVYPSYGISNCGRLFIINDPPYGSERVYNALRLAHALVKKDPAAQITVFLMADAVVAGKTQQKTPEGYSVGALVRHMHGCPWHE